MKSKKHRRLRKIEDKKMNKTEKKREEEKETPLIQYRIINDEFLFRSKCLPSQLVFNH